MDRLNRSEAEEFESQGFVVFDPQLEPSTVDAAVAELKDLYPPEKTPADNMDGRVAYRDARRIQDAWKIIPAVKSIALAPRTLSLLEEIYRRKPKAFQTLNFKVGSEQQPHSDTVHFNARPAGYMCGVWVALEDIDRDNGPVVYFPGSHKFPEVTLDDVDAYQAEGAWNKAMAKLRGRMKFARNTDADYAIYEKVIRQKMDASGITPRYATIRKGQAFIWAANLVHGGSHQNDRARTRMSQVTHYFFEGCRYYTPLLRRGFITKWRKPEWIV